MKLTASVVLYKTRRELVDQIYDCVLKSDLVPSLSLVDNSPDPCIDPVCYPSANYKHTGENLGYGVAHNLALADAEQDGADYHVILNPDIYFPPQALRVLANFMEDHPEVGLVMPEVRDRDGELQYLCKLLPTPFDLFGRRFLKKLLPKFIDSIDARLEMRSSGYRCELDVPWLSGCFMFLRVSAVKEVGGFDPRYFMYCEDIDFSRRLHTRYRTIYLPEVTIVHDHAKESFASRRMMFIHIMSAIKYFNKWGWWFDRERKMTNRRVTQDAVTSERRAP